MKTISLRTRVIVRVIIVVVTTALAGLAKHEGYDWLALMFACAGIAATVEFVVHVRRHNQAVASTTK